MRKINGLMIPVYNERNALETVKNVFKGLSMALYYVKHARKTQYLMNKIRHAQIIATERANITILRLINVYHALREGIQIRILRFAKDVAKIVMNA